ncbi:MAG: flagellar assembly protein A [bacterium]
MNAELLKKQQESILRFDPLPADTRRRDYSVSCSLSANRMEAYIKIETAAKECGVFLFDILNALNQKGVIAGVDYIIIEEIISRKIYNKAVAVAKGALPEPGADARLIPKIELSAFPSGDAISADEMTKSGVPVELDQVIVTKQPPTSGKQGFTTLGEKIAAAPGKDIAFEYGENLTVSEDGLSLISLIPGVAGLLDGKPCVREEAGSDWKFSVRLRKENMEAVLVIAPGKSEQPKINEEFIHRFLKDANITFGIMKDIVARIPEKIKITTVLHVATGKQPSPGKNAAIIERFRAGAAKSEILFETAKGKLIVEKIPAQPGENGMDVLGEPVLPEEGKDIEMKAGVNTSLSEDGLKLHAETDGYVFRLKEGYGVIKCGEFGNSHGPVPEKINYEGMVRIDGDLTKNHSVIAGHHVIVKGHVTGAEVVAGGFLKVAGKISDCSGEKIQSASDMFLVSASRSGLRAGGNIYFSGAAKDCEIVAGGAVTKTEDGSFSLAGGRVAAGRSVEVDEIGDAKGHATIVEAGMPFSVRSRYEHSVRELNDDTKRFAMIENEIRKFLTVSKTRQLSREETERMRSFVGARKMIIERIAQRKSTVSKLLSIINTVSSNASVTVRNSIHSGSIVKVGIYSKTIDGDGGGMLFRLNSDNTGIDSKEFVSKQKKDMTIMFTDIVGYSTYTSKHGDMAASSMLDKHNELLFPLVPENEGRIIKTIGDSIMAVFDKPENAVLAGIAMQQALRDLNKNRPGEHKIKVRIGINTGEGILDGGDVFGDAVNMAARVESLTDGDEIKISASTYSAAVETLDVEFLSLGLKKLKGKEELIEIFDVMWE